MARYFFNFRQGDAYTIDRDGSDFASTEEAYLGGFRAAQDMWRELLIERQDPLLCSFEVMDEASNSLFVLDFGEVLDSCRGRRGPMRSNESRPAIAQALESRRRAQQAVADVTVTLDDARTALRETMRLLVRVQNEVSR
jgi:hypothetical protein